MQRHKRHSGYSPKFAYLWDSFFGFLRSRPLSWATFSFFIDIHRVASDFQDAAAVGVAARSLAVFN
ncbi:MAG: hypothetical protein ACRETA_12025, partial [Gammaproteobacteria bacterium]